MSSSDQHAIKWIKEQGVKMKENIQKFNSTKSTANSSLTKLKRSIEIVKDKLMSEGTTIVNRYTQKFDNLVKILFQVEQDYIDNDLIDQIEILRKSKLNLEDMQMQKQEREFKYYIDLTRQMNDEIERISMPNIKQEQLIKEQNIENKEQNYQGIHQILMKFQQPQEQILQFGILDYYKVDKTQNEIVRDLDQKCQFCNQIQDLKGNDKVIQGKGHLIKVYEENEQGKSKHLAMIIHEQCGLWSYKIRTDKIFYLYFDEKDKIYTKSLIQVGNLVINVFKECFVCEDKGATLKCQEYNCFRFYHFDCALKKGNVEMLKKKRYRFYCSKHKRRDKHDDMCQEELKKKIQCD